MALSIFDFATMGYRKDEYSKDRLDPALERSIGKLKERLLKAIRVFSLF